MACTAAAAVPNKNRIGDDDDRGDGDHGGEGNDSAPESSSNVCLDPLWSPLPQPCSSSSSSSSSSPIEETHYEYVLFEDSAEAFYPSSAERYEPGTLCWVLKSKGRQQKSKSWKNKKKKRRGNEKVADGKSGNDVAEDGDGDDEGGVGASGEKEGADVQRSELFLRARVVSDDDPATLPDRDRRVLVRYPLGSTYRVRRTNLVPVLEPSGPPTPVARGNDDDTGGMAERTRKITARRRRRRVVLIASETPDYRRACAVHVCVGETFLEIGCDFGPTVDRVRRALTEAADVPIEADDKDKVVDQGHSSGESQGGCKEEDGPSSASSSRASSAETAEGRGGDGTDDEGARHVCLGIDKSPESIAIARSRYPQCPFSEEDALTDEGAAKLRALCRRTLVVAERDKPKGRTTTRCGGPSVVAVDINGNRDLPAVLRCLDNIMRPGTDVTLGDDWTLPRLIVVKSRELHKEVRRRRRTGLQL